MAKSARKARDQTRHKFDDNDGTSEAGTNVSGKRKTRNAYSGSSAADRSTAPDIPLPLRGNHTAVFHDTGAGFTILPGDSVSKLQEARPLVDPCEFVGPHRETFTHLARSVLVRMRLVWHGLPVLVLCGSDDLGCRGITLTLPCKLKLEPGTALDLEIFLPSAKKPIPAHAIVRKVVCTTGADRIRFKVEVEFAELRSWAEREIAAFVRASQVGQRRHLPA